MSVTQGNVKIRVELTGNGDSATRAVKGVREEIDKTTKSSSLLGDSTGAVKERVTALKGSVGGLNAVREGFEGIRANAVFAFTAIGGVVTGVMSMVSSLALSLSENAQAIAKWDEVMAGATKGLENTRDILTQIDEMLGRSPSKWDSLFLRARDRIGELGKEIVAGENAIKAMNDNLDTTFALVPFAAIGATNAFESIREEQAKLNRLKVEQANLETQITELVERQATATGITARQMWNAGMAALTPGGVKPADDLTVPKAPKAPKAPGGYRAPGQSLQDGRDAVLGTGKWAEPENKLEAIIGDPLTRWQERQDAEAARQAARLKALQEAMGDGLLPAKVKTDAEELRDALQGVADATSLVAERMPEMGAALAEVQGITANVISGKMKLGEALAAGGVAIAANAARAIGGVRAEAAVRAAYEFGMGWATLETPPISAGHFIASGLLAAVAGGAGKGGSSGASSSSHTSPRSTRVSTATTLGEAPLVQNINAPWFGGLQEGGAYVWEMGRRAAGTGYSEAA